MRTYPECYPCFLRQALKTTKFGGGDETDEWKVLSRVTKSLSMFDPQLPPPVMGREIQRIVQRVLGVDDLYHQVKKESTREVLSIYSELQSMVESSRDPLDTAVRLSIAGNIIDYGASEDYDLHQSIKRVLRVPFAINDMYQFQEALEQASLVLYLGDNAGETVFDRLLIETMQKPVVYVVKSKPVLNDATMEDAKAAGLDEVSEVIESGSDLPGTLIDECSEECMAYFNRADMIIAKGQGNFETLNDADRPIFFLLQTKCPVIADKLGVTKYSMVCAYHQPEMNSQYHRI